MNGCHDFSSEFTAHLVIANFALCCRVCYPSIMEDLVIRMGVLRKEKLNPLGVPCLCASQCILHVPFSKQLHSVSTTPSSPSVTGSIQTLHSPADTTSSGRGIVGLPSASRQHATCCLWMSWSVRSMLQSDGGLFVLNGHPFLSCGREGKLPRHGLSRTVDIFCQETQELMSSLK